MESRCCPTTTKLIGHTLLILGDNHDNTVLISDDGQGDVTVTYDAQQQNGSASNGHNGSSSNGSSSSSNGSNQQQAGDVITDSFSGVERIIVRTFDGDDLVDYALEGQLTENRGLTFDLGKGDDILSLDLAAGVSGARLDLKVFAGDGDDSATALFGALDDTRVHVNGHLGKGDDVADFDFSDDVTGGRLKLDLHGQDGDDEVSADFAALTDADVFVNAHLGKGDDTFESFLTGALEGTSKVRFNVHGHHGDDTYNIDASAVDIAVSALLDVKVQDNHGDDSLTLNYQGLLEGKLRLNGHLGHGDDIGQVDLTLDAGSTGSVEAKLSGGHGDDDLTLNVNVDPADSAVVKALLDGGQGFDSCVATSNVTVKNCEA